MAQYRQQQHPGLMMPHNGERHALPAAASGAPKVTGFKQLTDAFYEETAVTAFCARMFCGHMRPRLLSRLF
jgi:hypothetical protein